MVSYINNTHLEDLFTDVESRADPDTRLAALRSLESEFVRLTIATLEHVAFDLAERGWTTPQIAHELGVARAHIPRMIGAYAKRSGLLAPLRFERDYGNAVDISRLVNHRLRSTEAPAHPE